MKGRSTWLMLLVLAAGPVMGACDGKLLAELRSTSPLKAVEPDSSFVVQVFDSGCFSAHRPFYDRYAGTRSGRMETADLTRFLGEIESSKVKLIKPAELRQRLDTSLRLKANASAGTTLWHVADGNMLALRFMSLGKSDAFSQLEWRTLDKDLLNHPGDQDLLGIKATESLFMDLDRALFDEGRTQ